MTGNSAALRRFLSLTRDAIAASPLQAEVKTRAVGHLDVLLSGQPGASDAERADLPVSREHLAPALDAARRASGVVPDLAGALAALQPHLEWRRRAASAPADGHFHDCHANASVIGPGAHDPSDGVRVGVSLLAPHIQYPDHRHPPEELYIALSEGAWRQDRDPWHEPGIGGFVHNPPNVLHAMRSADMPLLAVWCLWPPA